MAPSGLPRQARDNRDDLAVSAPGLPHTDENPPISNSPRPPDASP